jgi:AraC-like DNA-binding protein
MIGTLNGLLDLVETEYAEDLDVAAWARVNGTTEYHLRRMFSSLAGMPLSEYVRRRRMTVAAADLTSTCSRSPSVTATAQRRHSVARSARPTASARPTYAATVVRSGHNPCSGSA